MVWTLMCLLLGLPLSAMATVVQQGSVGDGHVICCGRHDVLGVSRPRMSVLHQRCLTTFKDCFKSSLLQTHLSVYFCVSLGSGQLCVLAMLKGERERERECFERTKIWREVKNRFKFLPSSHLRPSLSFSRHKGKFCRQHFNMFTLT